MDVPAVIAALNDAYKLNSRRVVDLVEEAEQKTNLQEIELEGFLDFVRAVAIENESFEPMAEKFVTTLKDADIGDYREYIDSLESKDKSFTTILDSDYPPELKKIEKPPLGLYVDGTLESYRGGIALVGTRSATADRIEFAHKIGKAIVEHDRPVISGLATGIDEAGHRSAISHGGKTIGVLPAHIEKIYPDDNRQIAENIPKNGALISEVSNNVPLNRHRFVERNRITSGLSKAVVIGASKNSGGTVRQAEFANVQGIPILLYDPQNGDGQSPEIIKEKGAYSFKSIEELESLLDEISQLRAPNGGNLTINEYD